MINYIDTNLILAVLNENDSNHSKASEALDKMKDMVTSKVAVLELKSVLSRTTKLSENEIQAYEEYLQVLNIAVPEVDMDSVFVNAEEIAYKIRMRTLDLLHLSASMVIRANTFVTLDMEFAEKRNEISDIGLEVISL